MVVLVVSCTTFNQIHVVEAIHTIGHGGDFMYPHFCHLQFRDLYPQQQQQQQYYYHHHHKCGIHSNDHDHYMSIQYGIVFDHTELYMFSGYHLHYTMVPLSIDTTEYTGCAYHTPS